MSNQPTDASIIEREERLREWFTQGCDPIQKVVDGLDIGWGGVQRWATARMPSPAEGPHLDIACGYATFLAHLGWRFPTAWLVGLNIDFDGPHRLARPLLIEAGVSAALAQADARRMPFAGGVFVSASCFLGLQDIRIGFGEAGVREALSEAVRVLRPGGVLTLLDEFPFDQFERLMDGLPVEWIARAERGLDAQWDREIAMTAAQLYAEGWVAQMRIPAGDVAAREAACREALDRMQAEIEAQIARQGYYVPFGPVRMVVAQKIRNGRKDVDDET